MLKQDNCEVRLKRFQNQKKAPLITSDLDGQALICSSSDKHNPITEDGFFNAIIRTITVLNKVMACEALHHTPYCCSAITSLPFPLIRLSNKPRFFSDQFINLCHLSRSLSRRNVVTKGRVQKAESFRRDPPLCGWPPERAGRDGGMAGGMSHVAAQRGTKTQEIKVKKTAWKYSYRN